MKLYKTQMLDEAAAYLSAGFRLMGTEAVNENIGEFCFREKEIEEMREAFFNGQVVVHLSPFLLARRLLKEQVKRAPATIKGTTVMVGQGYWYIENGVPMHAVYGNSGIHRNRVTAGNFYKSKEEAIASHIRSNALL